MSGKVGLKSYCFVVILVGFVLFMGINGKSEESRVAMALEHTRAPLTVMLHGVEAEWGASVFIRILKEELLLELWVLPKGKKEYVILKKYPIAGMSGDLGPKTKKGDEQAPEGFYSTNKQALNPWSNYHLSFNVGYPNAYDRSLGRTGSLIMVHGDKCSIGCFAMTDAGIEEIYTLVSAALNAGQQSVPIQIYPFAMSRERLDQEKDSPHYAFWSALLPAWQYTETYKKAYPPEKIAKAFLRS